MRTNHKPIVSILCIFLFVFTGFLTAQTVDYTYDDNGNRIRRVITLKSAVINDAEPGTEDESNAGEENKEEYSDQLPDYIVKIYPNPTRGELNIEISGSGDDIQAEYMIYSQAGVLLERKKQPAFSFTVDFSKYPEGMYILRLTISGQTSVWNIINRN